MAKLICIAIESITITPAAKREPPEHVIAFRGTEYRITAWTRSEARAALKERLQLTSLVSPRGH